VFLAAAVPALIAASGVVALRRRIRAQGQNAAAPEPDVAAH
jgi:hypothetical protein